MTTHRACIFVARAYDPRVLAGPLLGDGTVFSPAGFRLFPGKQTVPLLVDHDPDRRVGEVTDLAVWDWVDGKWLVARCNVTDAPGWMTKGTRASFSYRDLHRYEVNGWKVTTDAWVDEVSVLSADRKPVEACAHVALLERAEPEREIIHHGRGELLVRPNCGQILRVY